MVITIVIILLLYLGIVILKRYFPLIPSSVTLGLYIVIFSVGIIYLYNMYYDISRRNNMNFDEINYIAPNTYLGNVAGNTSSSSFGMGNINLGMCIGQTCCANGTIWDSGNSVCVPGVGNINGNVSSLYNTMYNNVKNKF